MADYDGKKDERLWSAWKAAEYKAETNRIVVGVYSYGGAKPKLGIQRWWHDGVKWNIAKSGGRWTYKDALSLAELMTAGIQKLRELSGEGEDHQDSNEQDMGDQF